VRGNEQADKLAGLAPVGGQLYYDRNDVVRALWDKGCIESDETEKCICRQDEVTRGDERLWKERQNDHLISWQLVLLALPLFAGD